MGKKEEYKLKNEQFLQNLRTEEGVKELAAGVLYRILESGQGSSATPRPNSIVSVHYKGTLINGREFDNSWKALRRRHPINRYTRDLSTVMNRAGKLWRWA